MFGQNRKNQMLALESLIKANLLLCWMIFPPNSWVHVCLCRWSMCFADLVHTLDQKLPTRPPRNQQINCVSTWSLSFPRKPWREECKVSEQKCLAKDLERSPLYWASTWWNCFHRCRKETSGKYSMTIRKHFCHKFTSLMKYWLNSWSKIFRKADRKEKWKSLSVFKNSRTQLKWKSKATYKLLKLESHKVFTNNVNENSQLFWRRYLRLKTPVSPLLKLLCR